MNQHNVNRQSASENRAGKGCLTLFFFIFLLAGLLALVTLGREIYRNAHILTWQKVECTIISSEIRRGGDEDSYQLAVRYRYQVDGSPMISEKFSPRTRTSSDYNKLARLERVYSPNSVHRCYVNPRNQYQAYLQPGSLMIILVLPLPLIFIAIGAGGIWVAWRAKPQTDDRAISEKGAKPGGAKGAFLIFLLFFVVGAGIGYPLLYQPWKKYLSARHWTERPCTILESKIIRHSGDDGDTYSLDILYQYEFQNQVYKSNHYWLMNFSSSGYARKAAIVEQYPPGGQAACYVNPKDPMDSVLKREWGKAMLIGLMPMLFMLVGLLGMKSTKKGTVNPVEQGAGPGGRLREARGASPMGVGVVLKPQASPWMMLMGVLIFTLFWNGVVSVFLIDIVNGWISGQQPIFLTMFMLPFILIGMGGIIGIAYYLLALFNPRPVITLERRALTLGRETEMNWRIMGNTRAIRHLAISLEGREEATYTRGTSRTTDRNIFMTIPICEAVSQREIVEGRCFIHMPDGAMHSFSGKYNKIVWSLKIKGVIDLWPDLNETYDIEVNPTGEAAPDGFT